MSTSDYASTPGHGGRDKRSTKAPPDGPDGEIAALQRSAGNQAVGALIQAKLQVGAVDDPLEREADRVARKVVAGQHQHDGPICGACGPADGAAVRRSAAAGGTGPGGGSLDDGTDRAIRTAGGGRALDPDVQRSMESGFGVDFSGVRIHDDTTADGLNRELGARAFTTGADIFFRAGEYAPATPGGQELLAHELTHVVQQGAATAGDTTEVQRSTAPAVQRKEYPIGTTGEKLEVGFFTSKKERENLLAEAERIINALQTTYGVAVRSTDTVAGIRDSYGRVSQQVRDSLTTRAWRIKELRALQRALGYYAQILGANRAQSTRKDVDQEVTSVGKVKQAIDTNTPAGKLDTTTLGEYFASRKNMGLFKASEGFVADFDNEYDQLTGTFVHEVAHGLLAYAIRDFIDATGYWRNRTEKKPEDQRGEAPVTDYGQKNAAEDLCESAMMFFVDPARLLRTCPLRHAFMTQIGTAWVPPPAQAPQVQPEAKGTEPETVPKAPDTTPPELEKAEQEVEKIVQQVESRPEDEGEDAPGDGTDTPETGSSTPENESPKTPAPVG